MLEQNSHLFSLMQQPTVTFTMSSPETLLHNLAAILNIVNTKIYNSRQNRNPVITSLKAMPFLCQTPPSHCLLAESAALEILFWLCRGIYVLHQSEVLWHFLYPQSTAELSCVGLVHDCDPSHPKAKFNTSNIMRSNNFSWITL